jgi:hypothetical protein
MNPLLKSFCAATLLLSLSSNAAAQGVNADYLPFSQSRWRPFPLKRHDVSGIRGEKPLVISGVRLREEEGERPVEGGEPEGAYQLIFSGRDRAGAEWELKTEGHSYYEALYEGDLDRNGVRDLVLAIGTGGNGLAPPTHLVFLTFDRAGRPNLLEATGYFDARPSDIFDLADLDGDGRAELLFMVFDDGYWVTNLYRVRDARWSRVEGRLAGLSFPGYTRFTRRPNHRPARPAPGRNPRAPDLLKENAKDNAAAATSPAEGVRVAAGAQQADDEDDDVKAAAKFLAELQRAVADDDRQKVSRMVLYPLRVRLNRRRVVLRGRRDFLRRYDALFNRHIKQVLAAHKPGDELFRNWQGFMLGRGEIWFEQLADTGAVKIIAINNTEP